MRNSFMMNLASTSILINAQTAPAGLSKSQKRFNQLIKKIDRQRKQLMAWQETIPLCQRKYVEELEPLADRFKALQSEMVQLLDKQYPEKSLTPSNRKKLRHLICSIAIDLIIASDNAVLKTIYNKHSGRDFDAEAEEEKKVIKGMMEAALGIELEGDIDLNSPEDLFAQASEKMQQRMAQEEPIQQERHNTHKKSAKTLAKEKQQQEDAQNISKSLQEVYRKLASTLHPDKEQDPVERDRKTQLMQQVNSAYEKKDLLQLLELQLASEQIDPTKIHILNETRLVHYNKILSEQSKELEYEVAMTRYALARSFRIPQGALGIPDKALRSLTVQIQSMEWNIQALEEDLAIFQNVKDLKKFLKSYSIK